MLETVRRGVFKITSEGEKALKSGVKITNEYLMQYESFVEFVRPKYSGDEGIDGIIKRG
mgnify:CR=1 FL=1